MEAENLSSAEADMTDLFDFGQASMSEEQPAFLTAGEHVDLNPVCPSHPDAQR